MNFKHYDPQTPLPSDWDEFILGCETGSVHQTTSWRNFQSDIPGRGMVWAFEVRENEKLVACTLVVKMETEMGGKFWYYSARGPVFENEKAAQFCVTRAREYLTQKGGIFWRFDPYSQKALPIAGTKNSTQQYQPTDTLEIDLTQTPEDISASMKRKGRYNINLARKKGITIEAIRASEVKDQDLADFQSLNQDTTNRDGFSGHQDSYYSKFLAHLPDYAVLFFAKFEGRRIATAISTFCGPKSIYYFGASTSNSENRRLMAPYLLQWEMMEYARSQGCRTYDFLGIAPENEPKHAYMGISDFKWKFGGYRKTYAPGQEIIFQKGWYRLYKIAKRLKR